MPRSRSRVTLSQLGSRPTCPEISADPVLTTRGASRSINLAVQSQPAFMAQAVQAVPLFVVALHCFLVGLGCSSCGGGTPSTAHSIMAGSVEAAVTPLNERLVGGESAIGSVETG